MAQLEQLILLFLSVSFFDFTFELVSTSVTTVDWKMCSASEPKLETILGTSLHTCARVCGIQKKCFSFNYLTIVKLCELLTNDSWAAEDKSQKRPCLHGLRSNLKTENDCYEEDINTCQHNVCPLPSMANAETFGNLYTVGSRIKVECYPEYRNDNDKLPITCDENGQWNNLPNCSIQTHCGEPVAMANAVIGPEDTAVPTERYYKCNEGFETPFTTTYVTITCRANKTWTSPSQSCMSNEDDAIVQIIDVYNSPKSSTSFTFGFLKNSGERHQQKVYVVSKSQTNVSITAPQQDFRMDVTVNGGTEIAIPNSLIIANDTGIFPSGFHLESNASVAVYVENGDYGSVDGSVVIPDDYLSTEYVLLSWHDHNRRKAEFVVIGTADNTSVGITLPNGTLFQSIVHRYQMYIYLTDVDISCTLINSSKAIAVFAGHECSFVVDKKCDHLYDQMPPIKHLQTNFIVSYPYPRYPYVVRVIAVENGTSIRLSDGNSSLLNRAEYAQYHFSKEAVAITASKKVMVAVYSLGRMKRRAELPEIFDGSILIVPGVTQFKPEYDIYVTKTVETCVLMVTYPSYESSINNLRLNHGHFRANESVHVTMADRGRYTILYTELPKGTSVIYTIDGTPFGAYLSFFRVNSEAWFSLLYNFE